MSSNKDLLKLENKFRDDLPKYKRKPDIAPVEKPSVLTSRITAFLEQTTRKDLEAGHPGEVQIKTQGQGNCDKMVEMDVYITPSDD